MEIKKSIIGNNRTVLREYLIMITVVLCLGMAAGMVMYAIDPLKAHGQMAHEQISLIIAPQDKTNPTQIMNESAYIDNDYYYIIGQIHNSSPSDLQYLKINVTLYDKDHKMIGTDYGYADNTDLGTNQTTTFKLMIDHSDISTGDVHDIKAFDTDLIVG